MLDDHFTGFIKNYHEVGLRDMPKYSRISRRLKAQISSGQNASLTEAGSFIQAEQDVHVLDRLTGGALDQIIDDGQHHDRVAALGLMHRDTADIGGTHRARLGMTAG